MVEFRGFPKAGSQNQRRVLPLILFVAWRFCGVHVAHKVLGCPSHPNDLHLFPQGTSLVWSNWRRAEESYFHSHFHQYEAPLGWLWGSDLPCGRSVQTSFIASYMYFLKKIFFLSSAGDLSNLCYCWAQSCSSAWLCRAGLRLEAALCPANPFLSLSLAVGISLHTRVPFPGGAHTPLLQQMTQCVYREGELIETRQNSSLSGTALHTDRIILSSHVKYSWHSEF